LRLPVLHLPPLLCSNDTQQLQLESRNNPDDVDCQYASRLNDVVTGAVQTDARRADGHLPISADNALVHLKSGIQEQPDGNVAKSGREERNDGIQKGDTGQHSGHTAALKQGSGFSHGSKPDLRVAADSPQAVAAVVRHEKDARAVNSASKLESKGMVDMFASFSFVRVPSRQSKSYSPHPVAGVKRKEPENDIAFKK